MERVRDSKENACTAVMSELPLSLYDPFINELNSSLLIAPGASVY